MNRLAILGGGSWGTALAITLASRFDQVRLWVHDPALARQIAETRLNQKYLPGLPIPVTVAPSHCMEQVLDGAEIVLSVVPSHHTRAVYAQILPYLPPGALMVSATKGIENGTLLRMSEIFADIAGPRPFAVLSGPTFAKEVAEGKPAAMVAAAADPSLALFVQSAFSGSSVRVYGSTDVVGVELGGALKNVIAIGAGVCAGLQLGHNALAALITRGLAEMTRLAGALGGNPQTLSGLTGLGDLVLTCTGDLSRNRLVGLNLAKGQKLPEIVEGMQMVAEGVKTTASAMGLARRMNVEMPIAEQMEKLLAGKSTPQQAIRGLMERSLREE